MNFNLITDSIKDINLLKDFVLIKADPEKNRYKDIGNGKILWTDGGFNPHATEHCTQDGIVASVPAKLSNKGKVKLLPGDHIYCHHFLICDDNKIEINNKFYYYLEYNLIYCKCNGKIEMLDGWNFVEPIKEEKKSIIIMPFEKQDNKRGILRHTNIEMRELGVIEGDTVIFSKASDYEMVVEDKTYFRMDNDSIIAIEN